ncbi:hypothetical protein GGF46_002251 [Coemansia sp. RSA 552]|nr:hypothetical protein GGF46_002251 [Coemansia sp. RSA 552]
MRPAHTTLLITATVAALASGYLLMRGQRRPANCVFCSPLERVVYEDDEFLAFHDIKPDAALHLLVIPKQHRGTIKELHKADVAMIRRMHGIGERLLREQGFTGDDARFGFHRPPFNSVHHLHMHCLGLPFKPKRAEYMFPQRGSAWFMPTAKLILQLDSITD